MPRCNLASFARATAFDAMRFAPGGGNQAGCPVENGIGTSNAIGSSYNREMLPGIVQNPTSGLGKNSRSTQNLSQPIGPAGRRSYDSPALRVLPHARQPATSEDVVLFTFLWADLRVLSKPDDSSR